MLGALYRTLVPTPRQLAALGLSAAFACGPAPVESASAQGAEAAAQLQQALSGAQVERDYSGTLALITVTPERVELCTGTLLTPNLLATARHCVAPTPADSVRCAQESARFGEPHDTDSLWVSRERALRDSLVSYGRLPVTGGGDELVPVAAVFVPETPRICGGDLALVLLAEPLDPADAEPLEPRLDQPVEHGEVYTAVGFGATPDPDEQGIRRSRAGLRVTCTPDDCAGVAAVEDTEFRGGDGVCSGDSGGPAIDGAGRVTGVASRSVDCTGSVYSSLARWRDFVREVTARALREGDYPAPAWLEAPPEPEPEPEQAEATPPAPVVAGSGAILPDGASDRDVADDVADDVTSDVIDDTPASSAPVAAGAGGCSVSTPRTAASWQPLALLLGLALGSRARRSRVSRPAARC